MGRRAQREVGQPRSAPSAQIDLFAAASLPLAQEPMRPEPVRDAPPPLAAFPTVVPDDAGPRDRVIVSDAHELAPAARAAVMVGSLVDLEVDAIVAPTTSDLRGTSVTAQRVCQRAGRGLARAFDAIRAASGGVLVGDVVVTEGFSLRAQHIVHVVPPRNRNDSDDDVFAALSARIVDAARATGARSLAIEVSSLLMRGFDDRAIPRVVASLLAHARGLEIRFVVEDEARAAELGRAIRSARHDDERVAVHTARGSV